MTGQLSLSDPVVAGRRRCGCPNGNEQRATVADLLSHRLGLFGHAQDRKLEDGTRSALAAHGAWRRCTTSARPGTCHAYQNVAYRRGLRDGRAGDRPALCARSVAERLFAPLGMRGASMSRAALMAAPSWARPHRGGATPRTVRRRRALLSGAGGGRRQRLDRGSRHLDDRADGRRARRAAAATCCARSRRRGSRRRARRGGGAIMPSARRGPLTGSAGGCWIMPATGSSAIMAGSRGYRSMIMFDPRARSGVVALWNASTSLPNGLEYEVMDTALRPAVPRLAPARHAAEGAAPIGNELSPSPSRRAISEAAARAPGR